MDRIGFALLGLDHWYAAFDLARQLGESTEARLVAVTHDDAAQARQLAERSGAELGTADYHAALDRPDVQVAIVLYSTDRAPAIVREAAALGKHVVSVKPMAVDLATADGVVQAVRAAGVHYYPLDTLGRLNAESLRLKSWIDEGRIGQPLRFLQTLHSSLPQAWPGSHATGWWTEASRVPGGGWIDHAIYAIDTARWLFGAAPAMVRGYTANMRYPDLGVEDYGAATYTLANGAVALIEDTWTADRGYGFSRTEIVGSAGAICLDVSTWGRIALRGRFGYDGWVSVEPLERAGGVVQHMIALVRGTAAPAATVEDGRANLAACLAFYDAARTGQTVRVPQ